MRQRAILFTIGAALLLAIAGSLLLRGSSAKPMQHMQTGQSQQAAVNTKQVIIADFVFQPMTIKVHVGDTVTWTNQDSTQHSVVADRQSDYAPMSSLLSQGKTYSFTFTKAGTYTYHCVPHLDMRGTVIVAN